jgi:hypothetical protein
VWSDATARSIIRRKPIQPGLGAHRLEVWGRVVQGLGWGQACLGIDDERDDGASDRSALQSSWTLHPVDEVASQHYSECISVACRLLPESKLAGDNYVPKCLMGPREQLEVRILLTELSGAAMSDLPDKIL